MVLPLIDEHKPKCYLCHEGFQDIEELRKHQGVVHEDFFKEHERQAEHGPTQGDVSVF